MTAQRLRWMDLARGLGILLVISVHAFVVVDGTGLDYPAALAAFNRFLDPFRIPLLMFLSGMLLHKALKKPLPDYLWGKFCLIFWPFLLWSLVVYAAEGRLTLEYVLKTPISAPSVLWYLWFLTAYYVIALVLVRLRIPLLPVMAVCLIGAALLPSFLRMDRFSALLMFFLLGHYVVEKQVSLRGRGYLALLGLAAAVAGGLISAISGPIKYDPTHVWVPVGLILAMLWAAPFYRPNAVTGGLEWIGRNSIVFYAVHFPVTVVAAEGLQSAADPGGLVLYLSVFLLAVLAGAALQVLRSRFRPVAALFDFRVVSEMIGRAERDPHRSRPRDRIGPVENR